jgi:hypothetical protein
VPEDIMRIRPTLIAAPLLGTTRAIAIAQQAASYDPQQLPTAQVKVAQYSLTPRGDIDGVLFNEGTQVHLLPHLGSQIVKAIKPGDTIAIRELKAQAIQAIQACSLTNVSGETIVDSGFPLSPLRPVPLRVARSSAYRVVGAQAS